VAVAEGKGQLEFASVLGETAATLQERRANARVRTFWLTSALVEELGGMGKGSAERIAEEGTVTRPGRSGDDYAAWPERRVRDHLIFWYRYGG
jgi:hypothetical protein